MNKTLGNITFFCLCLLMTAGCSENITLEADSMNNMEETKVTEVETNLMEEEVQTLLEQGIEPGIEQETEAAVLEPSGSDENTRNIPPAPQAGVRSIENLLITAKEPAGMTMYVWGGGWNEEDTGAGIEAVTIGISPRWAEFYQRQDSTYNYKQTRYQIHDGLDCSGYIGWLIYNVFETQDGQPGYVRKAAEMASTFADYGWGGYTPAAQVTEWKPGDIMSMKGHVWLSLGMCEDGSVVLMHASPPGVRICGTKLADGSTSGAVTLAETYMKENYPQWVQRYPDCAVEFSYLQNSSQMRWSPDTLTDEQQIQDMDARQVLSILYP